MSQFSKPKPLARFRNYRATPAQLLVGGAGSVILLGTLLLALPQASVTGHSIGFINALFTATSAVCVTGLVVLDTPADLTTFGHGVLLFLFQVGGLGYMTAATFVALILGKRMGLRNRLVLKEAMASPTMEGLLHLALLTVKVTLVVEALTAAILTFRFMADMPFSTALWHGVFHGVSAFNNAGFALFSDSIARYRDDPWVTGAIAISILIGSLGFLVLSDLVRRYRGEVKRLTVHTRLTLLVIFLVGLVGSISLFVTETVAGTQVGEGGTGYAFGTALFASFASRTAGFATTDMAALAPASIFTLILLMAIGGGSGSAAGGIKVSTFGVICASVWSTLRGYEGVTAFNRTIPQSIVQKSFFLVFAALFLLGGITWMVLLLENTPFLPTLFEVVSAGATVGLSFGDGAGRSFCAGFSDGGKLLIAACMFIGRLGPLTIGIAVLKGERQQHYRLPEEKVLIG